MIDKIFKWVQCTHTHAHYHCNHHLPHPLAPSLLSSLSPSSHCLQQEYPPFASAFGACNCMYACIHACMCVWGGGRGINNYCLVGVDKQLLCTEAKKAGLGFSNVMHWTSIDAPILPRFMTNSFSHLTKVQPRVAGRVNSLSQRSIRSVLVQLVHHHPIIR